MPLLSILSDNNIKPTQKTKQIVESLLNGQLSINNWLLVVKSAKDSPKATCIEAMEWATREKPEILTREGFDFVVDQLTAKAPRIKWESAKVIANTAQNFVNQLDRAIVNLLNNAEHTGTVVRWSAATALTAIAALKTTHHNDLIPALEALCLKEEKGSIQKIYKKGLKNS